MSWDEYLKSYKQAVGQRQRHDTIKLSAQAPALAVEFLQSFHLPGPSFDFVSLVGSSFDRFVFVFFVKAIKNTVHSP